MLEPFFGGSHRDFALGLTAHSRHRIDLATLPDRFWKWRMRGAALHWAGKLTAPGKYDGLIVTDLMSLAELKGILGGEMPPSLLYFHENQLAYPLAAGESLDVQFGFTNIASALAAERIAFNSRYQMEDFLSRLPDFLGRMPDHRPMWVIEAIRNRSRVIYPGCRLDPDTGARPDTGETPDGAPLIIWNHRWEFDKQPDVFFQALYRAADRGLPFRVALLGERYREIPGCFVEARRRLGDRLIHEGHVEDRTAYLAWLDRGDIVISTAAQENFGIAVVEAVRCGCIPLLPDRLSYPEILPEAYHRYFLYDSQIDLESRLVRILEDPSSARARAEGLQESMHRFAWTNRIGPFDELIESMIRSDTRKKP
ncbi:MAG: tRNA-queuosine alpha-mannosyltransferase domain-containing protein [Desulfobacterales bacterium]